MGILDGAQIAEAIVCFDVHLGHMDKHLDRSCSEARFVMTLGACVLLRFQNSDYWHGFLVDLDRASEGQRNEFAWFSSKR